MAIADASSEPDPPLALGWVTWREEPQSLAEAQRQGALVLFKDEAEKQTYLIALASLVQCSEETLRRLLLDLDGRVWHTNEQAAISYMRGDVEAPEDHQGVTEQGIWVEQQLADLGLVLPVREVLEGRRDRLPSSAG